MDQPGEFCHPNTKMMSKTLDEAKKDCLDDQSCHMFYRVCFYSEFRQCDDIAGTAYEEPSTCGAFGPSHLYKKGNGNVLGHF